MKSVFVLRHEPSVSMGSLPDVLADAGLDARLFNLFESVPDHLPWSEAAGLIVLGGTMSANDGDRFPFLVAELDWIREAIRGQVPTLGICLGAQLLAKALGAAVYRNLQEEIGWYQIELLPTVADDRLFRDRCAAGDRLPLARRNLRFAGRRRPPGTKPALQASGFSLWSAGLWSAIPRRDGARVDGTLVAGV